MCLQIEWREDMNTPENKSTLFTNKLGDVEKTPKTKQSNISFRATLRFLQVRYEINYFQERIDDPHI